jgi:hypothetical protein
MMRCDLCGTTAKCVQKEIDCREYDVCEPCWKGLVDKLAGKGREKAAKAEPVKEYEEVVY